MKKNRTLTHDMSKPKMIFLFKKLKTTCNLLIAKGGPEGVSFERFPIETPSGIYALASTRKAPCHHIRQNLVDFLSYLMLLRGIFLTLLALLHAENGKNII